MTINNFDQSSTGLNLELSCSYDLGLSSIYFEETFHVLQYSDRSQNSILIYGMNHLDVSDFDFTDLDNYKIDQLTSKEIFKRFYDMNWRGCFENADYSDLKDAIQELELSDTINNTSQADLLAEIETYIYDESDYIKFLQDNFEQTFATVTSSGHCQGDYSEIIIPSCIIEQFTDQTVETIEEYLQEEIDHLLWDAPLYCRLTVDDQEYDLIETLTDQYQYDPKDTILENLHKVIEHDKFEQIKTWLDENFPSEIETY